MEPYEQEDELSQQGLPDWLTDPAGLLRRRWPLMLAVLVLGLAGTAAYVWTRIPLYYASTTVLLTSQRVTEEFVRPTAAADPVGNVDALIAETLSQKNLLQVAERLGLIDEGDPEGNAAAFTDLLRSQLQISVAESTSRRPPLQGQQSRVLTIGFRATDPRLAAGVANSVARVFVEEGVRARAQEARLATEFMKRELASTEIALREQQRKIAEFEEAHRGELPADLDVNLRRIERLQEMRTSLLTQIAQAETRLAELIAEGAATTSAPGQRLADARAELARQRAVNTETHPNVIALKRQVAVLEREAGGSGGYGGVAAAARNEIASLRAQLEENERALESLDTAASRIPARSEELGALQQRATVLQDTYLELLRKVKEAELAESLEMAQQGAQITILDAATEPSEPEKGRLKVALAGVIASLGLAAGVGLLLEWRDPVLTTADGVEAVSRLRVLGAVPRVS